MTSQLVVKNCDGGHYCSPPKECCKQGCCYLLAPSVYRPPTLPSGNMFSPLLLGHWYFWAAVTATLAGILCVCSLWRRHSQGSLCCGNVRRDERASEPDSNGSCYAPPHYSRCNSFHHAPPPYSEVTSKPDMYPLVISYNGDSVVKGGGGTTGYLMVQYFRNYIVRPIGSLSATSTIDSLSSSFLCNAENEANILIPPPYSCTGSLEEVAVTNDNINSTATEIPRSVSSVTCNVYNQQSHNSPSTHSQTSNFNMHTSSNNTNCVNGTSKCSILLENTKGQSKITNCLVQSTTSFVNNVSVLPNNVESSSTNSQNKEDNKNKQTEINCDASSSHAKHKVTRNLNRTVLSNELSLDSESQEEEHNFSDLLNLSVCVPSNRTGSQQVQDLQQSYSVANSVTGSDISSLANLGTPDSPPRATSPTVELRELLDKIQQLPQHKSPVPESSKACQSKPKCYFSRNKAKTLYMPLNVGHNKNPSRLSPNGKSVGVFSAGSGLFCKGSRNWLSRSAPNTPCGNFVPSFPSQKNSYGSKLKICDGSPLLNENDESDDDRHKDECL